MLGADQTNREELFHFLDYILLNHMPISQKETADKQSGPGALSAWIENTNS